MLNHPFETSTILKSPWEQPGNGSADPLGKGMVCSMQEGTGGGWYDEMIQGGTDFPSDDWMG